MSVILCTLLQQCSAEGLIKIFRSTSSKQQTPCDSILKMSSLPFTLNGSCRLFYFNQPCRNTPRRCRTLLRSGWQPHTRTNSGATPPVATRREKRCG
ncbi:hypothetical protein F5Y15DRAFT_384803 [Xylariaceae sp. FL0016]|nr:hypothetical protein F5Y15DRAFT_384803 [Xylariaceae sp. FL0016]